MNRTWQNGSLWEQALLKWGSLVPSEKKTLDVFLELQKARRILVVPGDRPGGFFFGIPVYKGLRQSYPEAEISIVCEENLATLARQIPFVDDVITAELDDGPFWNSPLNRLTRSLRSRRFDTAICLGSDCSFRLCVACARSGARLRVGFSRPGPGGWFNMEIVCRDRHASERTKCEVMLDLLRLDRGDNARWSVPEDRAWEVRCRYFFGEFAFGKVVGIDLSRPEGKGLGRPQVEDLLRGLIEQGIKAILFFTLAERKQVDYFRALYGNRILALGLQDLYEVAALLEGCRAVISCNTDLLHLSIFLQVPAVAIFDEDPKRWILPENDRVVIVQTKDIRAVRISEVLKALDQADKG